MKVVSYYLKTISRTMSSKLVFLYYDFRCLEALQLGRLSAHVYGTVTGGGLAIIKNLSLEGEHFQAFLMERVLIVSD